MELGSPICSVLNPLLTWRCTGGRESTVTLWRAVLKACVLAVESKCTSVSSYPLNHAALLIVVMLVSGWTRICSVAPVRSVLHLETLACLANQSSYALEWRRGGSYSSWQALGATLYSTVLISYTAVNSEASNAFQSHTRIWVLFFFLWQFFVLSKIIFSWLNMYTSDTVV